MIDEQMCKISKRPYAVERRRVHGCERSSPGLAEILIPGCCSAPALVRPCVQRPGPDEGGNERDFSICRTEAASAHCSSNCCTVASNGAGTRWSGARSFHGWSTNWRSASRGWGRVNTSVARVIVPTVNRSTSSGRGAHRGLPCRCRPSCASTWCARLRSASGGHVTVPSTTAFTKARWSSSGSRVWASVS